jgi:protein-S-isoprenylcysteine O-methyltransferase Ste14
MIRQDRQHVRSTPRNSPAGSLLLIQLVRWVAVLAVMVSLLVVPSGRWDLAPIWAYVGLFGVAAIGTALTIQRTDPSLFAERVRPGPGGKDPFTRRIAIPALVAHWLLAGLQISRAHGTALVPPGFQIAGLVGLAAALALAVWAISANRFFAPDVRIQRDRGHSVISGGPYRFVRHPGYLAAILGGLSSPLALGSWWSAVPVLLALLQIIRRTVLEDRLLQAELDGYREYASRVTYRLIPGLW